MSLSDLVRTLLDGKRVGQRREAPYVNPVLLRELARIGNNLNQIARTANRREPVPAAAILVKLIAIERELATIRAAYADPSERAALLREAEAVLAESAAFVAARHAD
ncbi:MobC family plasmid mobilization relaxosome protein [Paraburkholderia aspalathi]|nr:MobC family plasmid mobilization relaxosome protein [Paraburkholderia aspalathi]